MSLFSETLDSIKKNQDLKKRGFDLAIPFGFKKLDVFHPGIIKASYTLISANQKVGKSQITDYLYVFNVVNFLLNNKTNIKVKIFYFTLEMSKKAKMKQLISYRLFEKHKIRLTTREIDSYFKNKILDDNIIKLIEEDNEWFDKFEEIVEYIDMIKNPYGIYKTMENHFLKNGKFTYKVIEDPLNKGVKKEVKDTYIENDPNLITFCIIDNYANLTPEKKDGKEGTLYDAIGKFSTDYAIYLRNIFQCNIIAVQQQVLSKEGNDSIKLNTQKPSADGLSDNKQTAKDIDLFITLHSPLRTKTSNYNGYDITKLKDNYRELTIEFDRNGSSGSIDLFFDGAINQFRELPEPTDLKLKEVYDYVKTINKTN